MTGSDRGTFMHTVSTHTHTHAHAQQTEDTILINCWHCHLSLSSLNRHDLLSDTKGTEFYHLFILHFTLCVCVCVCACVPETAEGRWERSFKALIYDQHYEEMYQMGNTVYNYDNYNWRILLHWAFSCLWTYSFYRVILRSIPLLKDIVHLCCFWNGKIELTPPQGKEKAPL